LIINGENLVMGRLASFTAQKLLKGEKIVILNAEKAVINGNKELIYEKFKTRIDMTVKGNPHNSPKFPKFPDRIIKRSVRGMLPKRSKRGTEALKNLKVFIGVPKEFAEAKAEHLKMAEHKEGTQFIKLEQLSRLLGANW